MLGVRGRRRKGTRKRKRKLKHQRKWNIGVETQRRGALRPSGAGGGGGGPGPVRAGRVSEPALLRDGRCRPPKILSGCAHPGLVRERGEGG